MNSKKLLIYIVTSSFAFSCGSPANGGGNGENNDEKVKELEAKIQNMVDKSSIYEIERESFAEENDGRNSDGTQEFKDRSLITVTKQKKITFTFLVSDLNQNNPYDGPDVAADKEIDAPNGDRISVSPIPKATEVNWKNQDSAKVEIKNGKIQMSIVASSNTAYATGGFLLTITLSNGKKYTDVVSLLTT